jgi:hypothetical protein
MCSIIGDGWIVWNFAEDALWNYAGRMFGKGVQQAIAGLKDPGADG